ncbi:MAG: 3-hydroxyacyl-CoA dehydrogenase [Candidatus Freyarchaeota archaeon]|nr:3-hydroxyacyl-CoA dehydrogenase [Candidatus Jordarchaeia archaeon]
MLDSVLEGWGLVESVRRVAVVGAGIMGHGIAQLAAQSGYEVFLMDIKREALDEAVKKIRWSLARLAEKGVISKERMDDVVGRIRTTTSLEEAVDSVDFVIEAVVEDIEVKKNVFSKMDEHAPEHAVLASNTSTLPITEIASATSRPDKVVGTHFFTPPVLRPLVEVVKGKKTSKETLQLAVDLAKRLGKTVIICRKDVAGFIVNRILGPVLHEAAWTVYRGEATVEEVDSAIVYGAGLPIGAFRLADYIGIDTVYMAGKAVSERDPAAIMPCPIFEEYYRKGWLGQKTGRGFYEWGEKGAPAVAKEAGERINSISIMAPAVNAAALLVRNRIATVKDVDLGVKLGLGYPKGILELADEWGLDRVVSSLEEKRKKYGEYYTPDPLLTRKVSEGKTGVEAGEGFYKYK